MTLTVLGASVSPYVRKVRVVLEEKGIAYKLEPISPMQPPDWFREVSPLGRIPVLKDASHPATARSRIPRPSALILSSNIPRRR
jgi:glutathione S-transferase